MPLLGVANALANALHDDDEDEPWDALTVLKQWLYDNLGEEAAEKLIWGTGGAGVSSRISLNSLWLREPYRDMEGQDLWAFYAQQAAGPVFGGIVVKGFRGVETMRKGDPWKGSEMFLPKAFADVSKAFRYGTLGAMTKNGYTLKDDFDLGELMAQAAGFASHNLMKRYDANSAIRTYEQAVLNRRSQLIQQYYLAFVKDDLAIMEELLIDMVEFSKKNPELMIKPRSLKTSIKNRLRNINGQVNGMRMTPTIGKYAGKLDYGN